MTHIDMTAEEYQQWLIETGQVTAPGGSGNKYGAKKVVIDGHTFDSKAEGRRYTELKHMLDAGEIIDLELHPSWGLWVNDVKIGKYTADFIYHTADEVEVVEDVKGVRTRDYVLRKKLMLAIHGIDVKEVK